MSTKNNWRRIARVVVEFTTPFHIGSGEEGEITDSEIVRDANGLPAIPGSSIAGVVRERFGTCNKDDVDRIFGYQKKDENSKNLSHGSNLIVSWACIHDCGNTPVEGFIDREKVRKDKVLMSGFLPTLRDHVRINHLGAAESEREGTDGGRAKFDELVVPAGHRFTFELELTDSGESESWKKLLDLFYDDSFRFGGKTRRGLGAFKIVDLKKCSFDLSNKEMFEEYANHPASLAEPLSSNFESHENPGRTGSSVTCTMKLEPEGYWMFGGGDDPESDVTDKGMAPVRDSIVVWNGSSGSVKENVLVIPGSSVKGAISHRVTFHYNLQKGIFADNMTRSEIQGNKSSGDNAFAVQQLFGRIDGKEKRGCSGVFFIDDIFVEGKPKSQLVHHVSIDRFTGGARDTFLFNEHPLWKGSFTLKIVIGEGAQKVSPGVRKALEASLNDLGNGKLQLGAGSGRGNGFFNSVKTDWSDNGVWLRGDQ